MRYTSLILLFAVIIMLSGCVYNSTKVTLIDGTITETIHFSTDPTVESALISALPKVTAVP